MATDRLRILNGLGVKTPVRCCTPENITLSGLQTIDGIELEAGDRVLVYKQTNAEENGIYVAKVDNWTRALDLAIADDVVAGTLVYVASGDLYAETIFRLDPL